MFSFAMIGKRPRSLLQGVKVKIKNNESLTRLTMHMSQKNFPDGDVLNAKVSTHHSRVWTEMCLEKDLLNKVRGD